MTMPLTAAEETSAWDNTGNVAAQMQKRTLSARLIIWYIVILLSKSSLAQTGGGERLTFSGRWR
jgi:hypothetical protein